jgi:2'-5' RNA ligase
VRLFIAVEAPPPVVDAAMTVSDSLRERVRAAAPHARLTWMTPERMHLTIRFVGETDAAMAARIADLLAAPFATPSFTIGVGEAGSFPPRGTPRVLWLGLTEGRETLQQVEAEVSGRLDQAGIPRERRPFNPHLTLARVREPEGLRDTITAGIAAPAAAHGIVDAITLFESRLSPKGPTYIALQRIRLR